MKEIGRYDSALQMFVESHPRTPNIKKLMFLRWLVLRGRVNDDIPQNLSYAPSWFIRLTTPEHLR